MLTLARPEGYEFEPGQWFRLTLEADDGEQTRTFSHASAPGDPGLDMATRLSGSPFKQALRRLEAGDRVTIAGPGGRLGLPRPPARVVFLTGGVGITPVRSVLLDSALRGAAYEDALVVYGNREPACAPYLAELTGLASTGVRVVPVYEHPGSSWDGERGRIDAAMIRRHLSPAGSREFVVTGPPAMVNAMDAVLDELGVDVSRRIIERFGA